MITKTTNLDSQYMSLFDEIYEKSNHAIKVDSLEQFFGSIQEIAALDRKFLRLPLDEPMFVIDANARKINVDATPFKANGLSVQGDHLAETVFFKIDRYYDTMDLMNTNIYINWKMGSASARDICSIKSDAIIPGYVVFAWSIHDKITAKSGSLQFSVSLEIEQEGKNSYSLNTTPATLNIKEGLVLTNPEVLDMNNNITSILINSSFGDGTAAIGEVKWASGNGNGLVKTLDGEFAEIINLVANNNNGELKSEPVTLYALAAAGRDAIIAYSDSNKIPMVSTYVLVDKASVIHDNVVYYVADGDNYLIATQSQIEAFDKDREAATPLYVAVAKVELNTVGSYSVNAQGVKYETSFNEITKEEDRVKIGASALVECHIVKVPEPEVPSGIQITTPAQEYIPGYDFVEGTEAIFLTENSTLELSASADMKDNGDFGLLSFIWRKDNADTAIQDAGFERVNLSTLEVAGEGSYTVEVKHYRNDHTTNVVKSAPCVVSYYASPLTAEMQEIDNNYLILERAAKGAYSKGAQGTVKINYSFETDNPYSSEIKFELIHIDSEGVRHPAQATFSKESEGVEKCVINSADLPEEGLYLFKVSNIYNGSIFSAETKQFAIDIKD